MSERASPVEEKMKNGQSPTNSNSRSSFGAIHSPPFRKNTGSTESEGTASPYREGALSAVNRNLFQNILSDLFQNTVYHYSSMFL